ncbi:MAG: hypothetical protein EOP61_23595 [Sphingomonadales bacterium]|nr:MAG: hypothetical protein EOP61_23595 [Sphingomonadales bacterium]
MTGFIPAIAISAGLLSLDETSPLRAEYWPWLPLLMLVAGVAFSTMFWLVFVPWRDRKSDTKSGDKRD